MGKTVMVAGAAEILQTEGSMHKLKLSMQLLFCLAFVMSVFGSSDTNSKRSQVSNSGGEIEMTNGDLFGSQNWNSQQVRVLGFYLGMTRGEAYENARHHDLALFVPDLRNLANCRGNVCEVCNARGVCPGITLDFGSDERVEKMQITRVPEDAALVVREAAITQKFKGRTSDFFNNYSEELRVNLLGPGVLVRKQVNSSRKVPLSKLIYDYPERGLRISASLDESSPKRPVDIDLSVIFMPPSR
jgi:hypothetical protein